MRVVSGTARGTKLLEVPGEGTRPVMDRVKTALFDILRPRIADSRILDLFAGTGSIGIEALSQGAAFCTFIDRGAKAVATIRKNLELTGLASQAEVLHADSFGYLKASSKQFDLIYVAPPQYKDMWKEAILSIDARPRLLRPPDDSYQEGNAGPLVIAQIDPREYVSLALTTLRETRQKRYGSTLLIFLELAVSPEPVALDS